MGDYLKTLASETLKIISEGEYVASNEGEGKKVISLANELKHAREHTFCLREAELTQMREQRRREKQKESKKAGLEIEVTKEKSQVCAVRLLKEKGDVVLLNFASAKNQGGGFINGARAQEEDLCRASCLYACLMVDAVADYYEENRKCGHFLYTEHMIYSNKVPFFRSDATNDRVLDENISLISVITSPAPNYGEMIKRSSSAQDKKAYEEVLLDRAGNILAVAEHFNHRNLCLGAWGCGVFRNDPFTVAEAFKFWLNSKRFANSFDKVVFPCFGLVENYDAFRITFKV